MTKPYVCLLCRARIHLSRQARLNKKLLLHTSPANQAGWGSGLKDNVAAVSGDSGWVGKTEESLQSEYPRTPKKKLVNNGGKIIGRYSRKELHPEELLHRLDDSWTSSRSANDERNPPSTAFSGSPERWKTPGQLDQTFSALEKRALEFKGSVNRRDVLHAWTVLRSMTTDHPNLSPKTLAQLGRDLNLYKSVSPVTWELQLRWLRSLSSEEQSEVCPTPSEVQSMIKKLGMLSARRWASALWNMANGVHKLWASKKFKSAQSEHEASQDLLKLWHLGMSAKLWPIPPAVGQQVDNSHTNPSIPENPAGMAWDVRTPAHDVKPRDTEHQQAPNLDKASAKPVIRKERDAAGQTSRSVRPFYVGAALLTLDILRASSTANRTILDTPLDQSENTVSADSIESLIEKTATSSLPAIVFERVKTKQSANLLQAYKDSLEQLGLDQSLMPILPISFPASHQGAYARTSDSVKAPDSAQPTESTHSPRIDQFATTSIRRLGRAIEQQDLYFVERVRREVGAFAASHSRDKMAMPLELYEHLMMAFLTLRNLQAAMEIWKQIITSGYTPTVRTYTMMMRGAVASRDLSGMQAFWSKMHRDGVRPDEHAWSVRIFGLIKLKHIAAGMQALKDMGRDWLAAARVQAGKEASTSGKSSRAAPNSSEAELARKYPGPVNGVPKPNAEIVNSAVSALASAADSEIPKVLAWGRSFAVDFNVKTYNVLINIAMRHSQPDEALNILRRMQDGGIEADSTTWTVLLTALFEGGFLHNMAPDEQQRRILSFLDTLDNRDEGFPGINEQGYALIINHLLKQHENPVAAEAVLQRMTKSGQKPTMHIYTILMTSYFDRQPEPDLAAVEKLWRQISSENKGFGAPLDSIFYDRMVEGYARHHQSVGIRPMLGFLERMTQEGKQPGWKALEGVARALAEREEWDRLRSIVLDVRARLANARGATQHTGQRDFWQFVLSTGILSGEGITRLEHLMPREPKRSPLAAIGSGARAMYT